ncbi:unannotated protein [freshwater metagenome]|uniref:Unannotated protein n=1 Tax=freshwater metagenome TaxID=449393 RepID=A0A6J7R4M9_9ZZZZ
MACHDPAPQARDRAVARARRTLRVARDRRARRQRTAPRHRVAQRFGGWRRCWRPVGRGDPRHVRHARRAGRSAPGSACRQRPIDRRRREHSRDDHRRRCHHDCRDAEGTRPIRLAALDRRPIRGAECTDRVARRRGHAEGRARALRNAARQLRHVHGARWGDPRQRRQGRHSGRRGERRRGAPRLGAPRRGSHARRGQHHLAIAHALEGRPERACRPREPRHGRRHHPQARRRHKGHRPDRVAGLDPTVDRRQRLPRRRQGKPPGDPRRLRRLGWPRPRRQTRRVRRQGTDPRR